MRIITVRVPANGRAGVRIRASAQGRTNTISYPFELPSEDAHRVAARKLMLVMGVDAPLRMTHKARKGYTFHTVEEG